MNLVAKGDSLAGNSWLHTAMKRSGMTALTALIATRIFDGVQWHTDAALIIDDSRVHNIVPLSQIAANIPRKIYDGQSIVPGFVDLQVNGGGGVRFGDETSVEAIEAITMAHARFGTTKLLATLITDTPEVTRRAMEGGSMSHSAGIPGFLGLHLEGPHLSIPRKGAHNPAFIRPMTERDLHDICDYRGTAGFLLTTIAPENVTEQQVSALVDAGVIVSIGHSNVSAQTVSRYFDAGASMVTHLFNAMSPLGNREPGIVGASLGDGRVYASLIGDGVHVDPGTVKVALRAKALPGEIFLITDAMQTIGTQLESFVLNGREIKRSGQGLTLPDGTLAGSDIDMLASVKFAHEVIGLPLERALAMASSIPARAVRVDDRIGYLKSGYLADFVILSDRLDHSETWIEGVPVAKS